MCKSDIGASFCEPFHLKNNFDFIQPVVVEKELRRVSRFPTKRIQAITATVNKCTSY